MVDQWATDITAGHDTALLAWRRQDVADLNRLARARSDQLGHLHGEDLTAPGGRRYAPGDPVLPLAPTPPDHTAPTQPPTLTAVQPPTQPLAVPPAHRTPTPP